jgi:dTDP-4-amino-4,6-dideoxygalactose transaminase
MTNYLDSYKSIFLDITLRDFWTIFSLIRNEKRLSSNQILTQNLIEYWSEKNHYQNSYYLPLLCVRTGFDLFLRANQFPIESEIIMSAINIPSMITLVQCHKLNVIPCDINSDTLEMNINHIKRLITSKTVAIVYAHIYGRCVDVSELVDLAYEKQIYFIEDCAESFSGFCSCLSKINSTNYDMYCPKRLEINLQPSCYMGHPRSHLILYSFGVLKFCTSLGGGFAKISDRNLYNKMSDIYHKDPIQEVEQYLLNVKKYFYLYWLLNIPYVIKPVMFIVRLLNLNHMEFVISRLRAFSKSPNTNELFVSLRRQPCRPLLAFLYHRFQTYDYKNLINQKEKALYVLNNLEKISTIQLIGMNCKLKNFWLFPILVSKPDLFVKILSKYHIDAYRGTTQLNVITKQLTDTDYLPISIDDYHKCPNAEYLIEHVIYLPVHCYVPKQILDKLINIVNRTAKQIEQYHLKSKL